MIKRTQDPEHCRRCGAVKLPWQVFCGAACVLEYESENRDRLTKKFISRETLLEWRARRDGG